MLDIVTTNNLINLAKNGDEYAKSTLITENSPLIKSVIKKYINKGIEFDDLFQLGSLGFLKANIEYGLRDSELEPEFKEYLKDLVSKF